MGLGSGGRVRLLRMDSGRVLRACNSFGDNLEVLKKVFPLKPSGYFGEKGEGRGHTRNIFSDDPAGTALVFAGIATLNYRTATVIEGKGLAYTMRDGTVVTHRYYSSWKVKSPVVELNVHNVSGVRSQKIHFVKSKKGA